MEFPALIVLLLLSCSSLQIVLSQTGSSVVNTDNTQQQQQQVPVEETAEALPTAGANLPGEVQPEMPVADPQELTEAAAMDSLSGCRDLCDTECENVPVECEYVMDSIPVMCSNDVDTCKTGCERFCTCQYNCGCRVAEGCDDTCCEDCELREKPIEITVTTTKAAEVAREEGNGVAGMAVVYRKESSEEEEED